MKKTILGFGAAALSMVLLSVPPEAAEQKASPQVPQIEMSHVVTAAARVEAIDEANRTVTLKGPDIRITVKAEDWVDLDKIKPGDSVYVIYFESLVAEIYKKGEKPPLPGMQAFKYLDLSGTGEKPAAAATRQAVLTGKVQSMDTRNRIVVIEDPGGSLRAHKVKDPVNMDKLEEGDTVVLRLIQALAISIEKSSGK